MRSRTAFLGLLLVAAVVQAGCARMDGTVEAEPEEANAFSYDEAAMPHARPWTLEEFENNPEEFQFAIIGDRTGGANVQGTFALAIGQLNLLQPEFVINVGDIIEGYAEDPAELSAMWEEAEAMIAKLNMPFFFTRGNHDVSFPGGKEAWRERRGPNYYHFVYKDVLFMVLDSEDSPRPEPPPEIRELTKVYKRLQTEDPEAAQRMLAEFMSDDAIVAALGRPVEFPEDQMAWIEKTLREQADVRWTFLFMHEPCWENPSGSFKQIQALLGDRKHTFFAGHLHYYDYDEIDGVEHITLGPAGASWHHDGPGNVDHLAWVTMTDEGPQIANIALKGIFDRKGLDPSLFGAYDRKGPSQ
ncbi:MAG: metallophosphoesterase [Gemmatimonadota bacterium]|nr:MAG: metallophosphoesterase [Gemmatimonadota bacterium]